jgi:HPt (histidine-containing phosphotransfer) domain-containing protein
MNTTSHDQIDGIINVDELLVRCMGNVEIAERVLTKFQNRFSIDLSELQKGLGEQNPDLIGQAAHRIKGASANVSAPALYALASEIERLARAEQIAEISRHVERLQDEWTRFADSVSVLQLTACVPR